MSRSETLRLRDVRAAFRLVGEVTELGADPHDWWPQLLEGLCQLTGAAKAIGGEVEGLFFFDPQVRVLRNVVAGFDDDDAKVFRHFMAHEKWKIDEAGERYYRLRQLDSPLVVRSHEQLIAEHRLRRSEVFGDYLRPCRVGDRLYSFFRAPNAQRASVDLWHGLTLNGGLGDRPFTARQRRIVRLVHSELRPLVGTKLTSCRGFADRALSPRLRQTRDLLLLGHSEKQIADECRLAKSTVNEYVATLYRRYGVSSRAELMARFLRWQAMHHSDNSTSQMPEHGGPGESDPGQ